jgi:hypothetical protein
MVRRRRVKRGLKGFFERRRVIDLASFLLGVGSDME